MLSWNAHDWPSGKSLFHKSLTAQVNYYLLKFSQFSVVQICLFYPVCCESSSMHKEVSQVSKMLVLLYLIKNRECLEENELCLFVEFFAVILKAIENRGNTESGSLFHILFDIHQ